MPAVSSVRYAALAVLFSLLWASAFVVVKVALRDAPPLFLMASRFLVAGPVLLMLGLATTSATLPSKATRPLSSTIPLVQRFSTAAAWKSSFVITTKRPRWYS